MKIIAITQARYNSSRLPGKVLLKAGDKTLLQIHLERALKSKRVDKLILATTIEKEADEIYNIGKSLGVSCYRGSVEDVLDRFYQAAAPEKPDYVVRITSDCPLIDAEVIDAVIALAIEQNADYCSNVYPPTFPDGIDVEVFKFSALEDAWKHATAPEEREHVSIYIYEKLKKNNLYVPNFPFEKDLNEYRLTVDEKEDFDLMVRLIENIGDDKPWMDYANYIRSNADLFQINSMFKRNTNI